MAPASLLLRRCDPNLLLFRTLCLQSAPSARFKTGIDSTLATDRATATAPPDATVAAWRGESIPVRDASSSESRTLSSQKGHYLRVVARASASSIEFDSYAMLARCTIVISECVSARSVGVGVGLNGAFALHTLKQISSPFVPTSA